MSILAFYFHILTTMHGQNHIKIKMILSLPKRYSFHENDRFQSLTGPPLRSNTFSMCSGLTLPCLFAVL